MAAAGLPVEAGGCIRRSEAWMRRISMRCGVIKCGILELQFEQSGLGNSFIRENGHYRFSQRLDILRMGT